jgi:hypothetical protein
MKDWLILWLHTWYIKMVLYSWHWFSASLELTTYIGVSEEANRCAVATMITPFCVNKLKTLFNRLKNEQSK